MDHALYVTEPDGRFRPTDLARGGWSADAQHGGPPGGLIARAVEQVPTRAPMETVRMTMDLYREIRVSQLLAVETDVIHDGKRIQLVEALITADGRAVARGRALKIRTADVPLPAPVEVWDPPPGPEDAEILNWSGLGIEADGLVHFHTDAVEIRTFRQSFAKPGRGMSWFRLKFPVIAGEEPTPFVRVAALADLGNGNSQSLSAADFFWPNPDVTLYLHRPPEDEWLGMRSLATQHDSGIGFADSLLFDRTGAIGRVGQSQLLEPQRKGP